MRQLASPVLPFRGYRGLDAFGSGGYGAPRDGGARTHPGLDFIGLEGDTGIAIMDAIVSQVGIAYPGSTLGSIHLRGEGDFGGLEAQILYGAPLAGVVPGLHVPQGAQISTVQNVAAYWEAKHPERGKMTPHVHLRLKRNGVVVDPTPYMMRQECV